MNRLRFHMIASGFILLLLAGLSLALDDPAKTETKTAAQTADKAADATKTGAKETAKAAAKAADATASGTKDAAKATGKATTTASKATAKATTKAADETATGTEEAAKVTGKATTTAAKETAKATQKAADSNAKGVKEAGKAVEKVFRPADEDMLDINSATEEQLKMLPGIGSDSAAKIIAGRPYTNKTDLKSKGILPDSAYNRIAGFITARQK